MPLTLLLLFLTLLRAAAYEYDVEINNLKYTIDSNSNNAYVSGYKKNSYFNWNCVIPSSINAYGRTSKVVAIKDFAFKDCSNLSSITIPSSMKSISNNAFIGCSSLTSIDVDNGNPSYASMDGVLYDKSFTSLLCCPGGKTNVYIPNSVTTIGGYAFEGCGSLTSVKIPSSVTDVSGNAFIGCSSLTSIEVDNGNLKYASLDGVLYDKSFTSFLCCPGGKTNVTIPTSVTTIEGYAFKGCSSLTSVTIPSSVTAISGGAFIGCSSLTSIEVDNGNLKYASLDGVLYDKSFTYVLSCPGGKTNVTIPNSVITIASSAFEGCSSLTSVTIPNSVTTIWYYAFSGCSSLTSVTIPNSVIEIGKEAFSGCSSLSSVTISNSVTEILEYAFKDCSSLTSVTIPNSLKRIRNNTFSNCSSLTSVTIPVSVIAIEFNAFESCSSLTSVAIPNSVTTIGKEAFGGCRSLSEITIGSLDNSVAPTLTIVGRTFTNCPITKLTIGNVVKEIEKDAFLFAEDSSIEKVEIADMAMWTKNNDISRFAATDTLRVLAPLKNGVLKTFSNLKSLTIPCLSWTVDNPGNFGELFGGTSIEGTRAVVQYYEDGKSRTYYIPISLEELTISEGCGILPYGGLSNCNMLKKVTLPTSLYMVGEKALFGCAGVTDVYCQSADPAVAFSNSFDGMRLSSCKLHVPYNSADLYKAAEGWKRFTYIQEEAPIVIRAIPNILNAGVILGLQEYRAGQTAELRAVANSGYTFDGWFENGSLLTADDTYSFTVSGSRDLAVIFTPVSGSGPVTIIPEGTSITLTWPPVEGAESYEATLYGDAGMHNPVATVSLDGNGAVSVRHNAPGNLSANFAGLSELTDYYYSISAFDAQKATLSRYDGTFTTGEASVDSITDDAAAISGYYNLHGERSDTPWSGVNIVTYTDGSVRKMIRR